MEFDLIEKLGKIAGLAGIAFGVFFFIFRGVLQKNIFPKLNPQQGFKIINKIIGAATVLAVVGVGAWIFVEIQKTRSSVEIANIKVRLVGQVVDSANNAIANATIEVSQFPNVQDYSDSTGKFVIKLSGRGSDYVDLVVNHKDFQPSRKKVKVNYDAGADEVSIEPVVLKTKPGAVTEEPRGNNEGKATAKPAIDIGTDDYDSDRVMASREQDKGGYAAADAQAGSASADSTSITLMYAGDPYGCLLDIVINVAGQAIKPTSNSVFLTNVPLGQQGYTISGNINCGLYGACTASGNNVLNVRPNGIYSVMWANDNLDAHCDIALVSQ